jgi:predicted AlkP superfamily pyrophosphatase or phosphodiesterase
MCPRWFTFTVRILLFALLACNVEARGKAQHVVLIVWDGMRPGFAVEKYAPHLVALRRDGVFFANNHPVYPSLTNVNGTALATGAEPGRSGIIGNIEFRPAVDAHKPFDTSEYPDLGQIDSSALTHYLSVPTLVELLHKSGERTAISGSKPVAQLFDRARQRNGEAAKNSFVVYRGKILPRNESGLIETTIGPFPPRRGLPNDSQDAWSTRALTDVLWKTDVPKFSLLWLSEPDLSQHESAPGSPTSLAAIKSSDDDLGKVIAALKAKNALTSTDLFVVSDHGFSTIDLAVDVAERLHAVGFNAVRVRSNRPAKGEILVVTLGGSVAFYVADHDNNTIQRLIEFLQSSDFAGVIFTRTVSEGSFTFAQALIDTSDAPDVLVACRWSDQPNHFGVPGKIASDIGHTVDQGNHGSLSRYDMHNTLLATGPDFRRGWTDESPTGNVDVAPTILSILGLEVPNECDGRILTEAFSDKEPAPTSKSQTLEAHKGTWRQRLRLTRVGRTTYFMEGNGGRTEQAADEPNESRDGKAPHTPARSGLR